jgi:clan AA aspartic protease (TIGR02281 family)
MRRREFIAALGGAGWLRARECLKAHFPALRVELTAGLVAVLLVGTPVAGQCEDWGAGLGAYSRGDYAAAMRIFRPLAEQGHVKSQFYVGYMYYQGKGVTPNDALAAIWYQRAAEGGDVTSQSAIGAAYFRGEGVPRNYAEAMKWWRKAAEQGDAYAQWSLGGVYKGGYGVPQNFILAYMWYAVSGHEPDNEWMAKRDLEEIALHLAPSQIAEAQKLAQQCTASNFKACNRTPQVARGDDAVAPSSIAPNRNPSSPIRVPLKMEGGIFVVPVQINGVITLDFAIDSGASDVGVPADVFSTLKRAGTIKDADVVGQQTYVFADGSKSQSNTFMIRSLRVGDIVLENVTASVSSSQGSLLLGQSFLKRFKSWSIDNTNHELRLEI